MEMADARLALYVLVAAGALLLLLRFGKIVARYLIVFGALAAAIVLGLALYEHSRATRQAVQAATAASVGAAGASVAALILAGLLLAAVGGAAYFYLRWRLAERQRRSGSQTWLPGPNARWRRRVRSPEQPVIYIVEDEDEDDEDGILDGLEILERLDLEKWGFR